MTKLEGMKNEQMTNNQEDASSPFALYALLLLAGG
jgi:hypothetical protein